MSALVIVNPRSGNGRTAQEWPKIEKRLRAAYPNMAVAPTQRRGEATALARQALLEGCSEVVAVGGDGTINEVLNGFFDENGPISPDAVLAFVTSGTGGDFRKTFGIAPGYEAAIARLRTASPRAIDVGRVACISQKGESVTRYFVNIASFGMSGLIVDSVNRARVAKLFGGSFAFGFHSLMGALRYRDRAVRIRVNGSFDEITRISTVAVANGIYFGGGMKVAPNARPDDGLFEVIIMGGAPRRKAAADMKLIYTGEHLNNPAVRAMRGGRIVAVPVAETGGRPVLVEVDGESAGRLPATFEILPRALNLRC